MTTPTARVIPAQPLVVTCSPPGENRWGFYQFPDMWRAPGGEIYLAVNVGSDSDIGQHEPSQFFVSRDDGQSFEPCQWSDMDLRPRPIEFSDGSQVAFGATHFVYHVHGYGTLEDPWQTWKFADLEGEPFAGPILDSYRNNQWSIVRYADVPDPLKPFPIARRAHAGVPWENGTSLLEPYDLYLMVLHYAHWWDEAGNPVKEEKLEQILRPWPRHGQVVRLPDDTLIWAHATVNPESAKLNRMHYMVTAFASTDRGATWQRRGIVADATDLATDGFSCEEHSLQRLPNGDLLCVMRTEMGDLPGCSKYLAVSRSTDNGYTWSTPEQLAPFSVTPMLMALDNGTVAVAYGRPGVYVKASADSGATWTPALSVIGPPEDELLADRWWDVRYDHRSDNKISCGNLGEVVTGPDRFLLAYSDFRHVNENGELCKAVLVREFVIEV